VSKDVDRSDKSWLEPVLRRHLGRVPAPQGLWDRVVLPRMESSRPVIRRGIGIAALATALTASVFAVASSYYPSDMQFQPRSVDRTPVERKHAECFVCHTQ
jgi:hypothetical protein